MATITNPPKIKTFMLNNQKIQIVNDPLKNNKIHTNNLQIKPISDTNANLNYKCKAYVPKQNSLYSDINVFNANQSQNSYGLYNNNHGKIQRPSTQMKSKRDISGSYHQLNDQNGYHKRTQSANKSYFNKTHSNFGNTQNFNKTNLGTSRKGYQNSYIQNNDSGLINFNQNDKQGYYNAYDISDSYLKNQRQNLMGYSTFSQKRSYNKKLFNNFGRPNTGAAGSRNMLNTTNNYYMNDNNLNSTINSGNNLVNGSQQSNRFLQKKYTRLNNQTQNTLKSLSNLDDTKLDSSFKRTPVKKSYNNFLDTNQEMEQSATIKQMKSKIHSEMLKASKIAPQRSGQVKKRVLYKCFIQGTNNTQLVKNIIQKKQGWGLVGNQEGFNHLLWFDSAQKIRFETLGVQQQQQQMQQLQLQQQNQQKDSKKKQMVNHFQGYKELASKPLLLKNFEKICRQYKLQMFDFTPLSFIIDGNSNSYQNDFEDFLNIFYSKSVAEKQDLINIEILRRKNFYKQSHQESQQSYKYNNKNSNNNNVFQENQEVSQINKLKGAAQLRNYDTMHQGKNMWIFKPSDNNRGIGIRIFSTIQELILILQEFYNIQQIYDEDDESTDSHSNSNSSQYNNNNNNKSNYTHNCAYNNLSSRPVTAQQLSSRTVSQSKGKGFLQKQQQQQLNNNFVIQKYIEKPLLINERKFDIRIWVLIAPDMQLYVFKEGYLRLSGEKYNIQQNNQNNNSNKNQIMHLTNNAIQKHAKSYGKYEEGNQMNYDQFEDYLEKKQIDLKFRKKILPKMKEIVALTYSSVKEKLNPNKYENCFEIFGYDFFIDADYQVWLIEANTNPCLEESSQIQKELLPRMLNDAFKICLDKNFPCNFQQKEVYQDPTKKNFTVKGYDDAENLWEPCSIKKFNQIKISQ